MSDVRALLKHSLNYLFAQVATKALAFISIPVYTRILSVEEFGVVQVFLATVGIASVLLTLNTEVGISRYYYDRKSDDDFKEFVKYESQVKDLEEEFKQQAEKVVKDMEDNGEFEKYYLVASGKQEYLNKVEKLEQIKQETLKLNDILNNYSVKFDNLTIKDFETYKSIWDYLLTQKFINEPCEFSTEPLFKIKYLNKLYEVYKYKVEDSILKDRIQCQTLEGIKKDLTNVYIKEIKDCSNIEVKPVDKIFYKGENYEVYKFEVAESEFYKRVKAKSTISNRTRDFKNIYLKKL